MTVPGESTAQSFEASLMQAVSLFEESRLSETYDPASVEKTFDGLTKVLLSKDGAMSPADRITMLHGAADRVHELAAFAQDDGRSISFGGKAEAFEIARQIIGPT